MATQYADTLIAELNRHGVTDVEIKSGGKHPRLKFWFGGREITHVFPATPSDHRGVHNALSDLRRQMGVRRHIYKSSKARSHRGGGGGGASGAPACPLPTNFIVKPNPFDRLAPMLERLTAAAAAGSVSNQGG